MLAILPYLTPGAGISLAGIALIVVSVLREAKPEWGRKPLLIPIALAALAFGLDYAVQTDYESIQKIIAGSKSAAVKGDFKTIAGFLSPNYADSDHRDKASMVTFINRAVAWSSIKKVRTQAHTISDDLSSSELKVVVHLNNNQNNPISGGMFFVTLRFEFEKIGKDMYIKRADLVSVNNSPMGWGTVP